ncbi:unnamed protein product [Candida verbasci]|uniref:Dynactin subunit 4 n=1 Tax=Candida verbasci TaxID=1227364 RepID=A0A9W4XBL0_9ASCO|nr:unnamed protein product [Candida verbasci]
MSKLYNDSFIYCCTTKVIDIHSIDKTWLFELADLYFCPYCQCPKSKYEIIPRVHSKFCSNCLTDYTSKPDMMRCIKNCFICPLCSSSMGIKMMDHDSNGKSFEFSCQFCDYNYDTGVVYKPKSLHGIIEELKTDTFIRKCKQILKMADKTEELSERVRMNLKLSQLDKKEEAESLIDEFEIAQYPIGKILTLKKSIRCSTCRNLLLDYMESEPTINKFQIKFNAIDYLPTTSLTKLKSNVYLLHFVNPLDVKMSAKISSISQIVLSNFEFSLGASTSSFIKGIPSAYLSLNNSTAKSELILRKGDKLYNKIEDGEIEENLDRFIEVGVNWISIPIIIEDDSLKTVPIYVTLKTEQPPKGLERVINGLNAGYWNVLKVPK